MRTLTEVTVYEKVGHDTFVAAHSHIGNELPEVVVNATPARPQRASNHCRHIDQIRHDMLRGIPVTAWERSKVRRADRRASR